MNKSIKIIFSILLLMYSMLANAFEFSVDGICYNVIDRQKKEVEVTYYSVISRGVLLNTYSSYNDWNVFRWGSGTSTSANIERYYSGDVTIPQNVVYEGKTYTVTQIGSMAFYQCGELTSVTLPPTIKRICRSSFCAAGATVKGDLGKTMDNQTSNLVSVNIPLNSQLEVIEGAAFRYCPKLTSFVIPSGVTTLGDYLFTNAGMERLYCYITNPSKISTSTFSSTISTCTLYVPGSSLDLYKSTAGWKEFNNIEAMDNSVISQAKKTGETEKIDITSSSITLDDAVTDITIPYDTEVDELKYNRTFNNTNWQALYIPFSMSYSDWADDFYVARINNFHEFDNDNDDETDAVKLEVLKIKSGSTLPNHPYLIRAKTVGAKTITVNNAKLYASKENSVDCSSVETLYTFTGNYTQVKNMKTNNFYFMSGGEICPAANDDVALSPYRWYLSMDSRESQVSTSISADSKILNIQIVDAEEDATDIEIIENKPSDCQLAVFDLSGRRIICNDINSLPKGIFVINGKKTLIK